MALDRISLYRAPSSSCDVAAIATWLADRLSVPISVTDRPGIAFDDDSLPETFARARVLGPTDRTTGSTMPGIVRYEDRVLNDPERGGGVLYDGQSLQEALNGRMPPDERDLSHLHVIFLDRVLATWGEHDSRWHKRIAVLGAPTLLSVPGLVEAPAKPEVYYTLKQQSAMTTGSVPPQEVIHEAVDADILIPGDPRTTDAMKGYVLAAVDYRKHGTGFCGVEHCRLADSHRHETLISAQFEKPSFCGEHAARYGQSPATVPDTR